MPVVSRELAAARMSRNGTVLASFLAIDALGREWRKSSSRFVDKAAARAAFDAFDWTPQLKDADFADLLAWTRGGRSPSVFSFAKRDLALPEGEERLLTWFAEMPGEEAISLAWWVDSLSAAIFNAIGDRLAIIARDKTAIENRSASLLAAAPLFDATVKVS